MVRINLNDLRNYLDNYDIENITYNSKPVYTLTVDNEEIFNGADIFTYELLADDTYSISLADSTYEGSVVIPSMYNGKSISTIASSGFSGSNIKSVSFENDSNINTIGAFAFKNCIYLTDIILPDTVTTLEQSVFSGCTNLVNAQLSENITDIRTQTFSMCTNLKDIVLPLNLVNIERGAFEYCENISSISIPTTVELIGEEAFQYCTKLANVSPASILKGTPETIGRNAFAFSGITDTRIATYTKILEAGAFYHCESLTGATLFSVEVISASAFAASGLTTIVIPQTVRSIGTQAFSGSALTTVTIPKTVTTIGERAFAGTKLTSVNFEHNLWTIGNSTYKIENGQVGATALKSTYCTYSWTYYTAVAPRVIVNKPSYTSSLLEITIYNDNSLDLEVDGWLTYYLDNASPTYNLTRIGEEIVAKNSSRTYKHTALDRESIEITSFNSAKITGVQFIGSGLAALPDIEINKKGYVLTNGFVYPLHDQVYLNDNTSTSEIELDCMAYNENSKELDWYIIIYDLDDEVIAATQSYVMPEDSNFITISLSSSIYFEGGTYEMYFADSEGNESAHIFGEIS